MGKEEEKKVLVIRDDIDIVVESIGFKSQRTKFGDRSYVVLKLKDGSQTDIRVENDLLVLINTLKKYTGESVKSKKLVESLYVKDDKEFLSISVDLEFPDGRIEKCFVPYNFQTIINVYYDYLKKQK